MDGMNENMDIQHIAAGEASTPETQNTHANTDLIYYDVKDVARQMRVSIPTARDIMNRLDFPLLKGNEKTWRVLREALAEWSMARRD